MKRPVYITMTSIAVLSRNVTAWPFQETIKPALHVPRPPWGSAVLSLPFLIKKDVKFHLDDGKSFTRSHSLLYLG